MTIPEEKARAALRWAIQNTVFALPWDVRGAGKWKWDAHDVSLSMLTGDGQFRFHVAAEKRRGKITRIAVLTWEDDDGTATWEAPLPDDEAAPSVEAVNRTLGQAVLSDGQVIPITAWLGADVTGATCEVPPEYAVAAAAGPDNAGKWHSIDLSKFERGALQ